MLGILTIILLLFGALLLVGGIFFWLYFRNQKEPPEPNLPVCINFIDKFTPYNLGIEKSIKKVKNERLKVTMLPKDYWYGKKFVAPNEQNIIIGRNRRIILPRGTVSKKRDVVFYLPKNSEELTSYLKTSPEFANVLFGKINLENVYDDYLKSYREWQRTMPGLMEQWKLGEVSTELFTKMNSQVIQMTKLLEQIAEAKGKEKSYK